MKKKILSFGEIIWDVYSDKKVIGGAPLNFAAHSAICGMSSSLISAVGKDTLGEDALKALESFGVDSSLVKFCDLPTGQCIVTLDKNSVPDYNVLKDVAYDNIVIGKDDIEIIKARKYDVLYFGTLIQRNCISRASLSKLIESCHFDDIICDINLRKNCYDRESAERCLSYATILKISIEEEPELRNTGFYSPKSNNLSDIAIALAERFTQLRIIIITLGKDGSYLYSPRDRKEYKQTAIGRKVVSTVGAGDSFAASWLANYLNGYPVECCLKTAAEVSGFVVANLQAVPFYYLADGVLSIKET